MPLGILKIHGSPLTMRGSWIDRMKWLEDTEILNPQDPAILTFETNIDFHDNFHLLDELFEA